MTLRDWQNPWRLMLAVNAAVLAGVFLFKITLPPYVPYIHLLVDYHFGFTKRALIGAAVALFTAKVPVWLVFALAGVTWLITLALFAKLFQRTFGFTKKNLPLFVFIAGSPFFLKNFMYTLGHFDIYGCLLAIVLLLIPARSIAYVLLAAAFAGRACADPPHPCADVCADDRRHRGAAPLPDAARNAREHPCRRHFTRDGRSALHRRAVLGHDGRAAANLRRLTCKAGWPIPRAPIS